MYYASRILTIVLIYYFCDIQSQWKVRRILQLSLLLRLAVG